MWTTRSQDQACQTTFFIGFTKPWGIPLDGSSKEGVIGYEEELPPPSGGRQHVVAVEEDDERDLTRQAGSLLQPSRRCCCPEMKKDFLAFPERL
jgi:hypothetical protein